MVIYGIYDVGFMVLSQGIFVYFFYGVGEGFVVVFNIECCYYGCFQGYFFIEYYINDVVGIQVYFFGGKVSVVKDECFCVGG